MTTKKATRLAPDTLVLAEHAFGLDEEGLVVIGHPSFEVWSGAIRQANRLVSGAGFLIGDLINWGEAAYPDQASQVIDADHFDEKKTGVYSWVAEKIPKERRRLALFPRGGLDHHIAVARLSPVEQVDWLEKAAAEDWTVKEMRQHLRAAGKTKSKKPMVYLLEVECKTENDRQALKGRLESAGYVCRVK